MVYIHFVNNESIDKKTSDTNTPLGYYYMFYKRHTYKTD